MRMKNKFKNIIQYISILSNNCVFIAFGAETMKMQVNENCP